MAHVRRFMRTESLNHKFVYGSQITIGRLVSDVADSTSCLVIVSLIASLYLRCTDCRTNCDVCD